MQPRLFDSDHTTVDAAGELRFNGIELGRLARGFETPFFLISERILEDNYRRLTGSLAGVPNARVFYSVKTNFETGVLQTWRRLGAGAEISGELDLHLARRAGWTAEDIIFDGPCKTDRELATAVASRFHIINVESLNEIAKLEALAAEAGRTVDIGVRIDPLTKTPYYDKMITTYKRKFGFPLATCGQAFAAIRQSKHLRLVGLHAHIGSQILAPNLYSEALDALFRLGAELRAAGADIKEINVGGGFPAQSMRNLRLSRRMLGSKLLERLNLLEKPTPSIENFGNAIATSYRANVERHRYSPVIALEPGRSLVNNACVLVGRIRVVKGDWVFTDISINEVPENLFFTEWRVFFPGKVHEPTVGKKNLSGPTLSTYDTLFFQKEVPLLAPDDTIAIFDTGGYSIPRANQFTRPRSAVYFLERDGGLRLIRRRETPDDVVRAQVWDEAPAPAEVEVATLAAAVSRG